MLHNPSLYPDLFSNPQIAIKFSLIEGSGGEEGCYPDAVDYLVIQGIHSINRGNCACYAVITQPIEPLIKTLDNDESIRRSM